ncbi:MAG: glutamate--cysteine ligase [Candidatus Competibacteraceae bacterium]
MPNYCEHRLSHLLDTGQSHLLKLSRVGLERESLRVSPGGCIAQTPHPPALGAALTHPYITTDYSETLLEFITPPYPGLPQALDFLRDIQQFVYPHLGEELLWAGSMPCVATGENSIPIAWYGHSNLGMMKHVYRRGLGYRYGRMMQVIAGVHFNYSLDDAFWRAFQELEQDRRPLQAFRSDGYFRLIRNLQRFGWLIPYLFGASPALCKSFLAGRPTPLVEFDADTCFQPYGTSLRMSDIGYTNRREKTCGSDIHYDNLEAYVDTLSWATETLCPEYETLGVVVNGEYRQLNANILQIEAEYYSTVRPKQIPQGNEKPSLALKRRGVQYVELRSLDVNPFEPLGVDADTLRFAEAFMIFCLLQDSSAIETAERREIDYNQLAVSGEGRNPALRLQHHGHKRLLKEWAMEIVTAMEGVGEILDGDDPQRPYSRSLALQKAVIDDPERTPSAGVLAEMRTHKESFFEFAKRLSQSHRAFFIGLPPNPERKRFFEEEARQSWERQRELESEDKMSFEEFLHDYFAQT